MCVSVSVAMLALAMAGTDGIVRAPIAQCPSACAMAEALVEAMPQAELAVLNTGHFPYVEDPTGLLEAVSTFLTGIVR